MHTHRFRFSRRSMALLSLLAIPASHAAQPLADIIYSGGSIVTVNELQPQVEAVAVRGGKIVAVGYRDEVMKLKGTKTRLIDLGGKTLLPGFLDAHSHYFSSLTVANQVNVYAPPAGPGKDASAAFLASHYHRPSDDLNLPFNWAAGAKFAEVNYHIVRAIADQAATPRWYDDSFFGREFAPKAPKALRSKP